MPEVSDFTVLYGGRGSPPDDPIAIRGTREFSFNTGGRERSPAFLTFTFDESSIRRNIAIELNEQPVGRLIASWSSLFGRFIFRTGNVVDQSVYFSGDRLNDGSNTLTIRVPDEGGELAVIGIVCHFHQRA